MSLSGTTYISLRKRKKKEKKNSTANKVQQGHFSSGGLRLSQCGAAAAEPQKLVMNITSSTNLASIRVS